MSHDGYDVGYGKPPHATRWQKGQSGNPEGRPKKRRATLAQKIEEGLKLKIKITENGATRTATIFEAILLHLMKELTGKRRRHAWKLLKRYEVLAKTKPKVTVIRKTSEDLSDIYRKMLERDN